MKATWLALSIALLGPAGAYAQNPQETAEQRQSRLKWWIEARFGLFIHWGPVSLMGTEIGWSRAGQRRGTGGTGQIPVDVYDNLYKKFNPEKFDAREWVAIARDAGMKYLVFTTKHHDGFCMFDSDLTDYKITNSPFGRDVVKELADACHEAKMPLGFYYSPPDWHHPDYRTENHWRYLAYLHGHLRELCTRYGQVDIIWFDGLGGTDKDWDSQRLVAMIRQLQPHVIINNRAGLPEDHDTPEQEIGTFRMDRPWESCITIGTQWAWKPDDTIKSLKECVDTLVRCAGGDGNLLLNVGPMPDGRIEPRQADRLKEIGQWLAEHGPAIYGTRAGPWKPGRWGASTRRGDRVFVHVLQWPADQFSLSPLAVRKVLGARLLGGGKVSVQTRQDAIIIEVPPADRKPIDTVIELQLDGSAMDEPPVPGPASLMRQARVRASNVYQNNPAYGPDKAIDDDPATRWATDFGTSSAWLEVDLGRGVTFDRVRIEEAYPGRVQSFELQWRNGAEWRTLHRGGRIGPSWELSFEPITASQVRLQILQATEGPTIAEFQLVAPKK